MVDRQTLTVESDEELTREAEAARKTESGRDATPTRDAAGAADRAPAVADAPAHEAAAQPAPEPAAQRETAADPARAGAGTTANDAALFDPEATKDYQDRWLVIQTEFVDEPRQAVEKAESLVGEVMQTLTESFAREHRDLEARWSGDREVSTEDLRLAIRRYRSFFNRLLSL